jgi:hypothetical protein
MGIDSDSRRAWRAWIAATARWQQRWAHFLQHQEPLPVESLLGSRRAATRALMARRAAQQALLATRPAFPEGVPRPDVWGTDPSRDLVQAA